MILEEILVKYFGEEMSDFYYILFYSQKANLSFYSEYSGTTEGYERTFDIGKGKSLFEFRLRHFCDNAESYKWHPVKISLTKQEVGELIDFLGNKRRILVQTMDEDYCPELASLFALDEKIVNAKV